MDALRFYILLALITVNTTVLGLRVDQCVKVDQLDGIIQSILNRGDE